MFVIMVGVLVTRRWVTLYARDGLPARPSVPPSPPSHRRTRRELLLGQHTANFFLPSFLGRTSAPFVRLLAC